MPISNRNRCGKWRRRWWAEVRRKIVNSNRIRSDFLHRFKCGRPSRSSVRKSYGSWKLVYTKHIISNLHPTFSIRRSYFRIRCMVLVYFPFFFCVYKNSARPSTTGVCASQFSQWSQCLAQADPHRSSSSGARVKQIVCCAKLSSYLPLGLFWSSLYNTKSKDFPS